MPTFHLPLVRELKDVKLGSLISLQYFYQTQSSLHLGIRLGYQGSPGIAVLAFGADAKGKRTTFVLPRGLLPHHENIHPNLPVLDHGDEWVIGASPGGWDAIMRQFYYMDDDAGLLVTNAARKGMIAAGRSGSCFVDLTSWVVCSPISESFAATRAWTISVPKPNPELVSVVEP